MKKAYLRGLALALPIVAVFDRWGPFLIVLAYIGGIALFIYATRLPEPRPRPVRQAHPAARGGMKWIPGITVRVPFIPFLSIGLWRWRGRR